MTEREAWAEYIAGPEWTGKPADIWLKAVEFEREACAKVCEEAVTHPAGYGGRWEGYGPVTTTRDGNACAAAIRARSNA